MKIVDQTPFYKENGELSLIDRGKAIIQFGFGWFKEMEAQKSIIAVLGKNLDRNYTLLRNVIPAGMDARIPLIMVGPTGVFVMNVTAQVGMFRAKGDQWGTISGNALKPESPNLITRTERMARAVQVLLHRQGFVDLTEVEPVLLGANSGFNVDSLRPIVRIVMRDALERFAVSITQARVVFSSEAAHQIVNRILKPATPAASQPEEAVETAVEPVPVEEQEEASASAFALPEAEPIAAPAESSILPGQAVQPATVPTGNIQLPSQSKRRGGMSRRQWTVLIVGFVLWLIIIAGFGIKVFLDFYR
jgi:hypothetical protein